MNKQYYRCPGCGLQSSVPYEKNESIYSVIIKIRKDHESKSPKCSKSVDDFELIEHRPDMQFALNIGA